MQLDAGAVEFLAQYQKVRQIATKPIRCVHDDRVRLFALQQSAQGVQRGAVKFRAAVIVAEFAYNRHAILRGILAHGVYLGLQTVALFGLFVGGNFCVQDCPFHVSVLSSLGAALWRSMSDAARSSSRNAAPPSAVSINSACGK